MMIDSKHSPSAGPTRAGNVLDPEWEAELRRGQEEEGEAGTVEDELAFVHLLRHAREPEAIAPEQLDAIWSAIQADIAPAMTPWWRKAWVWWTAPALAAAAVLIVIVVEPGKPGTTVAQNDESARNESGAEKSEQKREPAAAPSPTATAEATPAEFGLTEEEAKADDEGNNAPGSRATGGMARGAAEKVSSGSAFEVSFAKLAPHGRLAIRAGVDLSRDELRSELLAKARGGGQ